VTNVCLYESGPGFACTTEVWRGSAVASRSSGRLVLQNRMLRVTALMAAQPGPKFLRVTSRSWRAMRRCRLARVLAVTYPRRGRLRVWKPGRLRSLP
jgi:hypothetical protein